MGVPSPWAVAAAVVAPVVLLRGVTNKGKKSSSGPKKNRFVKIKSSSYFLRFNYDQELTSVRQFAFLFFSSPFSSLISLSSRDDDGADPSFVCERVCASDRLLRRLGGLSKDPTPQSCVTVCGVSRIDSCTESCQRVVCMNMHQVPAWNDQCLKRCTMECQKGRAG